MNSAAFDPAEQQGLWRAIRERRDMRHFNGAPLEAGQLERLLEAARLAPSVGYMQPWRFIRITDPALRLAIHAEVEAERQQTAATLPSRQAEFLRLKIEGIRECSELLVSVLMPDDGRHIIGRRTMPDMALASAACAIQNLWLAARAEGIGMGWVSFFEPARLAARLALPSGARPIAVLCLGPVDAFYPRPQFEDAGFGARLPLDDILFENCWPDGAGPTPSAY
ncbi:5,6-dimethylbenzimidazole synthase [Laribacter hongkongensis]|uniref:5,6-dimethylbenzimidazole synthase n=1 Tax=Laribacter hongkongensis TaxID=168471 RepID=A0ABD4SQY2_9NEIS|nr:5,6-dimethylbenzimidazole synthase [Laribacter hongkongensis]MCG9025617.1 5,6-dimethylbenzimidazole synthase [Laribacter hongkongensis]MCG9100116.1 5,6-dimethylbenzimidazole synthase [Laribacter hongkongensis]MCG9102591.1 5,6-dimethylbenzimidazole synthase [Laribacter hongkongensis]MCG9113822.1 5,6-dimethylbenzimidazole synthase [Laribacter hongkongensis]MCG9118149.1 5,6-dimethylbenzimidazole synthase [Laribacter hongkongensis]